METELPESWKRLRADALTEAMVIQDPEVLERARLEQDKGLFSIFAEHPKETTEGLVKLLKVGGAMFVPGVSQYISGKEAATGENVTGQLMGEEPRDLATWERMIAGSGVIPLPMGMGLTRYFGSKSGQIKNLAHLIEPVTKTYREPFLGSGTIFRQMFEQGKIQGGAELAEANPTMRNIYRQVRKEPKVVAEVAEKMSERYNSLEPVEAQRFAIEALNNLENLKGPERVGVEIFVGQHGQAYNPPYRPLMKYSSNYITPKGLTRRIESFSEALRETKAVVNPDWKEVIKGARKGDLIIADPPYHGRRGYSVGWNESEEFAEALRKAVDKGTKGIVWNSPEALEMYLKQGFQMQKTGWMEKLPEYAASWGPENLLTLVRKAK